MAYGTRRQEELDPLGVRYGIERIYVYYDSHKTIVEAPNPDLFLLSPCTGNPRLLVKPWGGMWENGRPVGTILLKTAHMKEGSQWCSPVAAIVNKCSCGQEPCLERIPYALSDPPTIVTYNWQLVLDVAKTLGWKEISILPPVFAIDYLGVTLT